MMRIYDCAWSYPADLGLDIFHEGSWVNGQRTRVKGGEGRGCIERTI